MAEQTKIQPSNWSALTDNQLLISDGTNLESSDLKVSIIRDGTGVIPYSSDATGFVDACTDAVTGDVIRLGAITLSTSFTLNDGVTVIGENLNTTIIVGDALIGDGCSIVNLYINGASYAIRDSTAASDNCYVINCKITCPDDTGYAVFWSGKNLTMENCILSGYQTFNGGANTGAIIVRNSTIRAGDTGNGMILAGLSFFFNCTFDCDTSDLNSTDGTLFYANCCQIDGGPLVSAGTGTITNLAPVNLSSLSDVNITSPSDGAYLTWDGDSSKWIDSVHTIPQNLNDLTDVNSPSPGTRSSLFWDGSQWTNSSPPIADGSYGGAGIFSITLENGLITALSD